MDLGTYMKQRREEAGITIEKIAADTRIRARLIEDLEENRLDALPEKVFVRGFVRACAQTVGYDAGEAIDLLDDLYAIRNGDVAEHRSAAQYQSESREVGFRMSMAYVLLVIVALLTFSVAWFVNKSHTDEKAVSTAETTDVNSGTTRSLENPVEAGTR